jgi:hypothetical protein
VQSQKCSEKAAGNFLSAINSQPLWLSETILYMNERLSASFKIIRIEFEKTTVLGKFMLLVSIS